MDAAKTGPDPDRGSESERSPAATNGTVADDVGGRADGPTEPPTPDQGAPRRRRSRTIIAALIGVAAISPIGEPLTGHRENVYAVATAELEGRLVIVSGGEYATIRTWGS
ncbi:hypothetical protein K1T35_19075 [Pseudonocardia sp. DSM 110487]|uniref:hypothetical protein n=1 Tax=Pseudonocardia sp. DSM 110487 TaxID=2865833 RepID=UPI001C6A72B1|nr:hypothetical protein [Pseudonocardia sp. DSM 110487]QYN39109.1 hypothetical protein K1T35_19075 [Pseudonocardia sp. DSM 110487]